MVIRSIIQEILRELITEETQLKKAPFNELPFEYQRGLMTYMISGEPVEWEEDTPSAYEVDWLNKQQVQNLIRQYAAVHGDKPFEYGMMPTQEIIDGVMEALDGQWDDWDEYHKWYQSSGGVDHGTSVFPIILSPTEAVPSDEFIEDGWHRFHSYVDKGLSQIPAIRL